MEMDEAEKKEEAKDRKRKKYEEEDIGDEERATDKEDDGSRPVRTRGEKRQVEKNEIYEKQTVKFLRKLEKQERKRKNEGDQDEGRIGQILEEKWE